MVIMKRFNINLTRSQLTQNITCFSLSTLLTTNPHRLSKLRVSTKVASHQIYHCLESSTQKKQEKESRISLSSIPMSFFRAGKFTWTWKAAAAIISRDMGLGYPWNLHKTLSTCNSMITKVQYYVLKQLYGELQPPNLVVLTFVKQNTTCFINFLDTMITFV